jgi:uncharacterized damage-inducible protein DinB
MSIYSNRASDSADEAGRYIHAVLELLGDEDPMRVLGSSVSWCEGAIEGLSREQLTKPERDGQWSITQVLQHLADSELVWGYRLRKVLAEDRPTLTGYDQDRWAERLRYAEVDAEDALALFAVLRRANLHLLQGVDPTEMKRIGMHAERGEESVAHMVRLYAGHDLVHRNQIDRVRAALA